MQQCRPIPKITCIVSKFISCFILHLAFSDKVISNFFCRPASWANCSANIPATSLPKGSCLNTNGAGDAYTSGLLIASMLRHTGKITSNASKVPLAEETSQKREDPSHSTRSSKASSRSGKKMTPYTLYMKENYVTLKHRCKDDKKAIFTKCHEMWESETAEVKSMYERMVKEEYNDLGSSSETSTNIMSETSMDALDASNLSSPDFRDVQFQIQQTANSSLNLESAIQFASLVAAYHVNTKTRDLNNLDLGGLLDKSLVSLSTVVSNEI